MNDYLRVMNVSRNFQNSAYDSNQTRPLRNILDDFQRSLSQSLLWQNERSSFQQNNNYQNPINSGDSLNYNNNYQLNANPADRIWNSATNFAGNVAEKALDFAGNFVNAALNSENIKNKQLSEDRSRFPPQNNNPTEHRSQPVPQNSYPPEPQPQQFPPNGYPPEHPSPPPPEIGFSNIQTDIANKNSQKIPDYNNNRQLPYPPPYTANYYQETNPSRPTWNPTMDLGQKIEYIPGNSPGIYYYKQSDPIELLLNPTNQYSSSRRYRQMPPTNKQLPALGQIPFINNRGINSASTIVNSALSLAQSIVTGDYDKIIRSSINMGKDISNIASGNQVSAPQTFKRSSPNEKNSNLRTAVLDGTENVALNYKNDGRGNMFKSLRITPNIAPNLLDSDDIFLQNSSIINNSRLLTTINKDDYIQKSNPTEPVENSAIVRNEKANIFNTANSGNDQILGSVNNLNINPNSATDSASKNDNIPINSEPHTTGPIWNFATPLTTKTGNIANNGRLVGIRRILRSPYGSGTYLEIVPLKTLYNPSAQVDDVSNIPNNPSQFGTTFLYL
jgi:hypothetical protein